MLAKAMNCTSKFLFKTHLISLPNIESHSISFLTLYHYECISWNSILNLNSPIRFTIAISGLHFSELFLEYNGYSILLLINFYSLENIHSLNPVVMKLVVFHLDTYLPWSNFLKNAKLVFIIKKYSLLKTSLDCELFKYIQIFTLYVGYIFLSESQRSLKEFV